jgi:hypothetical protein
MAIAIQPSKADWERLRKNIEVDDALPCDANDPEDGPNGLNDKGAAERFMRQGKGVAAVARPERPLPRAS